MGGDEGAPIIVYKNKICVATCALYIIICVLFCGGGLGRGDLKRIRFLLLNYVVGKG